MTSTLPDANARRYLAHRVFGQRHEPPALKQARRAFSASDCGQEIRKFLRRRSRQLPFMLLGCRTKWFDICSLSPNKSFRWENSKQIGSESPRQRAFRGTDPHERRIAHRWPVSRLEWSTHLKVTSRERSIFDECNGDFASIEGTGVSTRYS
jgi:hypothetical protein